MPEPRSVSPWTEFKKWLTDSMPNAQLPEHVQKAINPRSVLCMFSGVGEITIFLNHYLNTFRLSQFNEQELYMFLKELVQKNNIRQNEFTFLHTARLDKSMREIRSKMPFLKDYDLAKLIDYASVDVDEDEAKSSFLEYLGLTEYKKLKVKKKAAKNEDFPSDDAPKKRRGRPPKNTQPQNDIF